jgi:hypothetical protein
MAQNTEKAMETFNFTEWGDERLEDKLGILMELAEINGHPRMEQIQREMAHVVFELTAREQYDV